MDPLDAISPVDGRYRKVTEPLSKYFSERGLMSYRIRTEGEYLIALSEHPEVETRQFSQGEIISVRDLYNLPIEQARIIKAIETQGHGDIKRTNHDVKAVEYYMKMMLKETSLSDSLEWIHFALTSDDINNIAYALALSDGIGTVVLPVLEDLVETLDELAHKYKDIPMLARTHGQAASPSTVGKEYKVFSARLQRQVEKLKSRKISTKLNGATGNYDAHVAAYPNIDWLEFTEIFIESLNRRRKILQLEPNYITTQIEPHDTYAELYDNLKRINNIVVDFDQDMWRYISDAWIKQKIIEGEVGSSTMPHKVNPIDFENSEANLEISIVLSEFFSRILPRSRLQRHLSDSSIIRNFGVALSHGLIGYKSALRGLGKTDINKYEINKALDENPEVISEAIQTILRRENIDAPYEKLKELTRGRKVTMDDFRAFIDELEISDKIKEELRAITPQNYIGLASQLATL